MATNSDNTTNTVRAFNSAFNSHDIDAVMALMTEDCIFENTSPSPDGSRHECAINRGRRPTFFEHADTSVLEAHLLDFDDDLYGEPARVQFQSFLRSERKFDGIDPLVSQLKHDVDHARKALAS